MIDGVDATTQTDDSLQASHVRIVRMPVLSVVLGSCQVIEDQVEYIGTCEH